MLELINADDVPASGQMLRSMSPNHVLATVL
jgi:hypothetical protein